MKRILKALAASVLTACLAGCGAEVSQISDASVPVVTIGSTDIKKSDAYSRLVSSAGEFAAVSDAKNTAAGKEIKTTDEIRQTAQDSLNGYKADLGSWFNSYLDLLGMSEDDYMKKIMIPTVKTGRLPEKYIEGHAGDIVKNYKPVLADWIPVIDASAASSLKDELSADGADPSAIASSHGMTCMQNTVVCTASSEDSGIDKSIRSYLYEAEEGQWSIVEGASSTYVVRLDQKLDEDGVKEHKADLAANPQIVAESTSYYCKKYNFKINDQNLYDAIKAANPECIVD